MPSLSIIIKNKFSRFSLIICNIFRYISLAINSDIINQHSVFQQRTTTSPTTYKIIFRMKRILIFVLFLALATPEPTPSPVTNPDQTFIKRSAEANAGADPTFIKKVVVAQPYPVYYRHYPVYHSQKPA